MDVDKLQTFSLKALADKALTRAELGRLSCDELIELNLVLSSKYFEAEETLREERASLQERKQYQYSIEQLCCRERVELYSEVNKMRRRWAPLSRDQLTRNKLRSAGDLFMNRAPVQLRWDEEQTKFHLFTNSGGRPEFRNYLSLGHIMSSSLLLYRLLCLIPECHVSEGDGYKAVWSVFLEHKVTKQHIGFSEHKGCVSLYYCYDSPPGSDTKFDADWLSLLNLLFHPECPHPYDGTVAGSAA